MNESRVISAADLLKKPFPKLRHGQKWGNWTLDLRLLTLNYSEGKGRGYEIDLEDMTDSAPMLDWIMQMSAKPWMTPEQLGHLVRALDEVFHPQAYICSFGANHEINPRKHVRARADGVRRTPRSAH